MNYPIRKLSAASRKRVTRIVHQQMAQRYRWATDAICSANAAEFDGDHMTAMRYDAEALALSQEIDELGRSLRA